MNNSSQTYQQTNRNQYRNSDLDRGKFSSHARPSIIRFSASRMRLKEAMDTST